MPFHSFRTGCQVFLCDFHREQAWERWVTKKENGVCNYKDEVLCLFRRVARAKTQDQYHIAVEQLKSSDIWKNNPKLIQWFGNKWLKANKVIRSIPTKEENKERYQCCAVPENIHSPFLPPAQMASFCFTLPSLKNSSLASYFASKMFAFLDQHPPRNFQLLSLGWLWIFP